MFIDRQALVPYPAVPVAKLREQCVGCTNCKGACRDLLEMQFLPDLLELRREART